MDIQRTRKPRFALNAITSVLAGTFLLGGYAQAADQKNETVKLETVQVTGTRIKKVNLVEASPVTTIGSEEIEFQGATRVEDLLNNLPQVFADQGGSISNGATGTATVNLRNLGAQRTLVLIDGKRLIPGDPKALSPDLNFIPALLVDHVDVLTGGASAVYGSDAVAGVVNFVMKNDFEGVALDVQRSGYWHSNDNSVGDIVRARGFATPNKNVFDGKGDAATFTMGFNTSDGKGNATLYASYLNLDPLTQAKRDFSACTLAEKGNSFACSGSGTNATGDFFTSDGSRYTVDKATGNTFIPYKSSRDAFNFGPYNYYQRNDERYNLGAFAHYKFGPAADVYSQVMFMDDHTDAVIAPSGAFGVTAAISCTNPLLSQDEKDKICGPNPKPASSNVTILRRNVEGGGRDDDLRHTSYRIITGIKGDFLSHWNYDASVQYSSAIFTEQYKNDFSIARLQRALNVVAGPGGTPVCQSTVDGSDPNCVPWNIWTLGAVAPAALAYLQTPGFQSGYVEEQIATGSVSGDLGAYGIASPFAKDGVGISVGAEYRRDAARNDTDVEFSTGDLAGQGGATVGTAGAFHVKEVFGELKLPILQKQPFAEILDMELGYRRSDYSGTGIANAYKVGGNWAPTRDVMLRMGFNRAVRAPNIIELSSPLVVRLDGSTDPCEGPVDPATGVVSGGATKAQCLNDPLIKANPALYGNIAPNSAQQYNGRLGSSPGLQPETANTFTAGLVITPTAVKNLSITIDYYDIRVKGLIGGFGADTILQTCYQNGSLCSLIHRDPATTGPTAGTLWLTTNGYVDDTTQNTGSEQVRGIDFNADYRLKLGSGLGSMNFLFLGTRDLKEDHRPVPGNPSADYKCAGKYGKQCGTPVPTWRHKLRATWNAPWSNEWVGNPTVSAQWRFIGSVTADSTSTPNSSDQTLATRSYLDLAGSLVIHQNYSLRLGINNVLDKDPPIIGSGALPGVLGNGNTFPQVYDALGRYVFLGMKVDF